MKTFFGKVSAGYLHLILGQPVAVLVASALIVGACAFYVPDFQLDASSDALVLENDAALRLYQETRDRYGTDDSLIVTYSPRAELFAPPVLGQLRGLRDDLRAIPRVETVTSILDVPLIASPPVTLADLRKHLPTLDNPKQDLALARRELLSSPLYENLLISEDGQTTALAVTFEPDTRFRLLQRERDALRGKERVGQASSADLGRLEAVSAAFELQKQQNQRDMADDIAHVRAVLDGHRATAQVHLGGVPMIVADSIAFIGSDLVVFGTGVLCFLVLLLSLAFRAVRWVCLPLATCAAVAVVMMGFLGWAEWPITVVSSNFLSVLLIITLSLTIHLIVAYQEVQEATPEGDAQAWVRQMIRSKIRPCAYTAATTAVAFGSLVVSGIRPVIDFGWMMVVGVAVAFFFAFTLFPAACVLLAPPQRRRGWFLRRVTASVAERIHRRPNWVLSGFAATTLVLAGGLFFLSVENRFIDYFHESTAIHQGMLRIDQQLGGTTPLEILIDPPALEDDPTDPLEDEEDEDDWDLDAGIAASSHWFRSAQMGQQARIHAFLDDRPETGKVLSLWTSLAMLESIEPGLTSDDIALSILYKKLPVDLSATLVEPYFNEEADQLRFAIRVFESDASLNRSRLLEDIQSHLVEVEGIAPGRIHQTGMVVLYNNLLQSLFRTQILTVGVVFFLVAVMFLFAFRSLRLAAIAIVPNVFAGGSILGIMGWFGIPLDLMTITIAAISIGIGVDDTIHYVHRWREEVERGNGDPWAAIARSHATVGRAMIYTTVTIALGFSILMLSNFVPTAYFGALTGLAMLTALVADLSLLPVLMASFGRLPAERGAAARVTNG